MEGWMIALIVVAAFVALVAIAVLAGALIFVHSILGRRKELSAKAKNKKGYTASKFGVDSSWFDTVVGTTSQATISAYDGVKLGARIIRQPEPSKRVAVLCHGYGATLGSTQVQAKMFYDRGFDVYMPAMRGHKGSGGKVGMAWIDRFDLSRWVDRIIADYGETVQIALFGTSLGGSTVVAYAGMNPPPQVKCVIDDCGFSSQYEEYIACLKGAKLPTCAIHLFNMGLKLVHGYSLYDADIAKLAQNMTIPALFFHGTADSFVPFALGQKLFEACASQDKSFVAIEGAGHGFAYATDKAKYTSEFTEFVDKHIEGSELVHLPTEQQSAEPETPATEEPIPSEQPTE
ncbi:MAG: lysophospholipase [Clostridiales bacterium]|nr:lysophospholipase [Clostridiales bacterium]